jgi:hypothetical protein
VSLDLFVVPSDNWGICEIRQTSPGSLVFQFVNDPSFHPVVMTDQHALRGAFLTPGGVGILVALPGDVIDVHDIWPKDFPVHACVFEPDFPFGKF